MNNTELKTLRQSLFLSVAEAAALHGVNERVYRYWESGDWAVPDDVAARVLKLDDDARYMAGLLYDLHSLDRQDDRARPVLLVRYASDADVRAMASLGVVYVDDPTATLPAQVHAAGIDRARQMLRENGFTVRVATMDRAAYQAWLDDHEWNDSVWGRELWANTVIDPPTRAKKIAQASSEQKSAPPSSEQKSV